MATQDVMQAALIRTISHDPVLGEIARPTRKPGQVLIAVRAAALNPIDQWLASGQFYLGHPPLPYVPGCEGAGVVLEGDGTLQPGTRVRFECPVLSTYGSLAPRTVVESEDAIPIPDDAPDDLAASIGIAGMAGWLSVASRAQVSPGERVVVLGATGVVGQVAVQAARWLGAGRIVAVGRNREALDRTRELGADGVVALEGQDVGELAGALQAAAGGPIDVVIDGLWGNPALAAMTAAGPRARVVNLGQSSAPTLTLPSGMVRGKMLSLLGYSNMLESKAERRRGFQTVLARAVQGDLVVERELFSLAHVAQAWRQQHRSPHKKLVVTLPEDSSV